MIPHYLAAASALLLLSACASRPAARQASAPDTIGPPIGSTLIAPSASQSRLDLAHHDQIAGNPAAQGSAGSALPATAQSVQTAATTQESAEAGTRAEQDAQALYTTTPVRDPWEAYNRKIHGFNRGADKVLFRPVAVAYDKVTPKPVKTGVRNMFANFGQPGTAVSQLLQGRPVKATQSLGRFLVNSTVGVAGLFDPATRFGMPRYNEDVGQVFATWGWRDSRYFVMPILGPGSVRDTFGRFGDQQLTPINYLNNARITNSLMGLQLADGRARMFPMDAARRDAIDDYTFVRDAWTQRRQKQIAEE
ncbi:VacJ family lipoprotein [Xanthomonas campestris pv. ionidii]|nr:VacJ family lipoprotein [Xanthomonas campestris pv. ionidii]